MVYTTPKFTIENYRAREVLCLLARMTRTVKSLNDNDLAEIDGELISDLCESADEVLNGWMYEPEQGEYEIPGITKKDISDSRVMRCKNCGEKTDGGDFDRNDGFCDTCEKLREKIQDMQDELDERAKKKEVA